MHTPERSVRCGECRRNLDQGADAVRVEAGVLGPRGFVPLEKPLYFCSQDCVGEYFSGTEPFRLQRKIP